MPVHSRELRLTYYAVPKIGSSTMRTVLWALSEGREPAAARLPRSRDKILKRRQAAAPLARAQRIAAEDGHGFETLVLVRDPLRRFLSGFQNKVRNGQLALKLGAASLPGGDLPSQPDLETFLTHLPAYRKSHFMIRQHFRPIHHFLGPDLSIFDHVHQLERFGDFAEFLSTRLGRKINFPHVKKQDMRWVDDISPALKHRIQKRLRKDYKVLHRFYGDDMLGIAKPEWLGGDA